MIFVDSNIPMVLVGREPSSLLAIQLHAHPTEAHARRPEVLAWRSGCAM